MAIYKWQGINAKGLKRRGKMEAPDPRPVEAFLKRMRIHDYTIKEAPKDIFENIAILAPKVKSKDIMVFTRQLATMIEAGLPLVQCLKILAEQQENRTFKLALTDVNNSVQAGSTLSDSMRKFHFFDELYCNLIAAGETAGILDTILKRLAAYIEKAERLKRKVKGALVYPTVVMAVAIAVIIVIMVFVIPVFQEIFESFDKEMPVLTQLVINLSMFLKNNLIYAVMATGVVCFIIYKFVKTPSGRYIVDQMLLQIPVFGDLLRKMGVAKFTRTLSTMIKAGVPIITSLEVVARTAGNKVIEEALMESRSAIAEGRALTDPLMESGIFPNMVLQMIAVGEEAGALDSMLEKVADFYDEEVDAAVEAVMALIEPMLIVFLGVTVGTLVIAMYLPIFGMAGAIES